MSELLKSICFDSDISVVRGGTRILRVFMILLSLQIIFASTKCILFLNSQECVWGNL